MNAPEGASESEVSDYLDEVCGGDADQRRRLDGMFAAARRIGPFMTRPEENWQGIDIEDDDGFEKAGTMVGNYKLLQEVGKGGFGVVYMAEQQKPIRRRVALKIIKLGMDTRQVVARFEVERQALAMMDHPNIARVLDAGVTGTGRPFFVMELVRGIPITKFCDEQNLNTEERLKLFIEVCGAVQHAHQKGIIHRDLKPSNVMVTMRDDRAVPKVIDFGVAKATQGDLTDKTLFTQYEQFIGTPAYMSPEQAQLSELDIDTRSDVYALGVLLYELLTGTTPFDPKELNRVGQDEIRRKIREEEPPKPSTRLSTLGDAELTTLAKHRGLAPDRLCPQLRGDLDWIIMRALEKDRKRRYETANGFALDIQRHLDDDPVMAAAPTRLYRMRKYARRNRAALGVAAAIVGVLILGSAVSSWLAVDAIQARDEKVVALHRAEDAGERLARQEENVQLRFAEELLAADKTELGVAHLVRMVRAHPENAIAAERLVSALTYRDFAELVKPIRSRLRGLRIHANSRFVNGGKQIIGWTPDSQTVYSWDLESGSELPSESLMRYESWSNTVAISPDQTRIAVPQNSTVTIYDGKGGLLRVLPQPQADGLQFSPDGKLLLVTMFGGNWNGIAQVWEVDGESAEPISTFAEQRGKEFSGVPSWSPDSSLVITGSGDRTARVWDARTGKSVCDPLAHGHSLFLTQFSPDGKHVLTGGTDHTAQVWCVATGTRVGAVLQHEGRVNRGTFSPDGTIVATGSMDNTARLWDARTGLPLGDLMQHDHYVWRLDFNEKGDRLITGTAGGLAQVWDVGTSNPIGSPFYHGHHITSVKFSPDEEHVLTISLGADAGVWKLPANRPPGQILRHRVRHNWAIMGGKVRCARFSPDGKKILTATRTDGVQIWDATSGDPVGPRLGGWVGYDAYGAFAAFSPGGNYVVTTKRQGGGSGLGHVAFWDLEEPGVPPRKLVDRGHFRYTEFSADGEYFLASTRDGTTHVWKVNDGEPEEQFKLGGGASLPSDGDTLRASWARFRPSPEKNERLILAPIGENSLRLHDIETGTPVGRRFTHDAVIEAFEFSPDGGRIVVGSRDGHARVWDVDSGQTITPALVHSSAVKCVNFSPDGRVIVTGAGDGTARLWDAVTGEPLAAAMNHASAVTTVVFSPDGRRVATTSLDSTARVWDAESGLPVSEPLQHDHHWVNHAEFSPDSQRLVTAGNDGTARVWEVPSIPTPIPDWFCDWAESIVGKRVSGQGTVTGVDWRQARMQRDAARERSGGGLFEGIVRWFHADPEQRSITPFSLMTVPQFVEAELGAGTIDSLEEAVRVDHDNVEALLMLARQLARINGSKSPAGLRRAEYYARQALQRQGQGEGQGGSAEQILAEIQSIRDEAEWSDALLAWESKGGLGGSDDGEARATGMALRTAALGRVIVSAMKGYLGDTREVASWLERTLRLRSRKRDDAGNAVPEHTLVARGSEWRYLDGGKVPAPGWVEQDFDDTAWSTGLAELGFADAPVTEIGRAATPGSELSAISFYFRHRFEVQDAPGSSGEPLQMTMRVQCDDGAVVYLNGLECLRINMPSGTIQADTLASSTIGGTQEQRFQEFLLDSQVLRSRSNTLAVEVHQAKATSSDVSFDLELVSHPPVPGILDGVSWAETERLLSNLLGTMPETLFPESRPYWRFAFAPMVDTDLLASASTAEQAYPWRFRAHVQAHLGRPEQAIAALERVHASSSLSHDPVDVRRSKELQRLHATLLEQQGRYDEAERLREEASAIPTRDPALMSNRIDLSDHYNEGFFASQSPAPNAAAFQWERLAETFEPKDGVSFDLRGKIQLNSGVYDQEENIAGKDVNEHTGSSYPSKVEGIPVGHRCQSIHFLQSCRWGREQSGVIVATYLIHYEDGEVEEVPVVYGEDMLDAWVGLGARNQLQGLSHVAWLRDFEPPWGIVQLLLTRQSWPNPHPEKAITHIDFISAGKKAAPFLVGITVEQKSVAGIGSNASRPPESRE